MESIQFDAADFKKQVKGAQNTALNFAPLAMSTAYRHQNSNQTRGVTMRDTVSVLGSEKYRGSISMNGNVAELYTGIGDYLQLNRGRQLTNNSVLSPKAPIDALHVPDPQSNYKYP